MLSASVAIVLLFASTLALARNKRDPASASIFQADKGKFSLLLNGKEIGHEDFEIAPAGSGWLARGSTFIKTDKGSETKVTGNLTLQPDGQPLAYDWTSEAEQTNGAHILFSNGVAKITLQLQGSHPYEQSLTFNSPMVVILDNNLYNQYAVLARIYDWSRRGQQQLPVLIPQELTPGVITLEATGAATSGGKSYEGLRVSTSDLEVDLLLATNHKLMRIEVPSANVSVVRQ